MRQTAWKDNATGRLLRRAALFRAIALGFNFPDPGHAARVRAALPDIPHDDALDWTNRRVSRAVSAARRAWRFVSEPELRAEYTQLFLRNAPSPPHETAYGDGRRIAGRTTELADIAAFYRAFGLELASAQPDLPDHLCSELEFYSVALLKEAYAASRSWNARACIAKRAAKAFLHAHLGRWVGAFNRRLGENQAPEPYRALGRLLETAVRAECRRLRVRPERLEARLPFDEMQAEHFICPREAAP